MKPKFGPSTRSPTQTPFAPVEDEPEPEDPAQSSLPSTMALMRETLSLQEVELVELKELVLTHLTANNDTELLKEQLSQVSRELTLTQREVRELREEVRALKEDGEW